MKRNGNSLIVTNISGSDIPGFRLVRQRRPDDEIPKVVILERMKRDGKTELHIVIRALSRKDKQHAREVLKSLADNFEHVPEEELYAKLYPEPRTKLKLKSA